MSTRAMAVLGALLGLVATVQGVAWLGREPTRTLHGAVLAPVGLSLLGISLLHLLVPDFFG
jgi:hypothetical protein